MIKTKNSKIRLIRNLYKKGGFRFGLAIVAVVLSLSFAAVPLVKALTSAEIAERAKLQNKIKQQESEKQELSLEASSLEDMINELQGKIATHENQIRESEERVAAIQGEINEAEAELTRQRTILGENIKASYLDGQISTLEMLASSKDLSEFVDKQQYRNSVQDKIKTTLDKITALKQQLSAQQEEIERYIKDQEKARDEINKQKAEQDRLLNLNEGEQNALNNKIKANSARIAALNQKQVNENRALLGGNIPSGVAGGGGYKYGDAKCLWPGYADPPCREYDWGYPDTSGYRRLWDEWGYGYRNCTSWGAFRVAQVKGYTPAGLTGLGHAKYWPSRTSATVNNNPSGGDATVAISQGTYGHVRFVENVFGDGSIEVSDYNLGGDGAYRRYTLSAAKAGTLTYIHF